MAEASGDEPIFFGPFAAVLRFLRFVMSWRYTHAAF